MKTALAASSVLLTAATRWEAEPLAKALGLSSAAEGRWDGARGGRPIVLVKTGIGAIKTSERLENELVAGDYALAISAGLCGAMQEGVRTGDLVADAGGLVTDYVAPLKTTADALGRPLYFGRILHSNVVLRPAAKRTLGREQRALACDMETAAVRRWAGGKTPVLGLRAVLDELGEELPSAAPEDESPAGLARFALEHAAELPLLLKTGLRSGRAMRGLSRFLTAYLEAL